MWCVQLPHFSWHCWFGPSAEADRCPNSLQDYTAAGGLRRLHMLLPDEAEKLQRTPFAIVQVRPPSLPAAALRHNRSKALSGSFASRCGGR